MRQASKRLEQQRQQAAASNSAVAAASAITIAASPHQRCRPKTIAASASRQALSATKAFKSSATRSGGSPTSSHTAINKAIAPHNAAPGIGAAPFAPSRHRQGARPSGWRRAQPEPAGARHQSPAPASSKPIADPHCANWGQPLRRDQPPRSMPGTRPCLTGRKGLEVRMHAVCAIRCRHHQSSMPRCAGTPALNACLTSCISVTVSASSMISGGQRRPVRHTCTSLGRSRRVCSTPSSGSQP